jgi:hypothetical protein
MGKVGDVDVDIDDDDWQEKNTKTANKSIVMKTMIVIRQLGFLLGELNPNCVHKRNNTKNQKFKANRNDDI